MAAKPSDIYGTNNFYFRVSIHNPQPHIFWNNLFEKTGADPNTDLIAFS